MLAANTWGVNGLVSRYTTSPGRSVFYTWDRQGGCAQRLDSSGNVLGSYAFDGYGNRQSTDNSADPYSGYGGQWGYYRDAETGLSLLGARYYDSGQGRFLNRDPIGYDGGTNLYSYAANNPLAFADPSGLTPCWADDDGSPAFDKCYESDLEAGDHPGAGGVKKLVDTADFLAHFIPYYPLIPALTGHDIWGCALTPGQRALEAVSGGLPLLGHIPSFLGGASEALPALGLLEGKSANVTQKGLDIVTNHLAQFGSWPQNDAMLERLGDAMANGQGISGADLSFYTHELSEATMMGKGMSYEEAHDAALLKYGVSRFSVYHPDVISAYSGYFNPTWRNAWGLR